MKRILLLTTVLLSLVILGTTAYADVRTSGPGPLMNANSSSGWTTN